MHSLLLLNYLRKKSIRWALAALLGLIGTPVLAEAGPTITRIDHTSLSGVRLQIDIYSSAALPAPRVFRTSTPDRTATIPRWTAASTRTTRPTLNTSRRFPHKSVLVRSTASTSRTRGATASAVMRGKVHTNSSWTAPSSRAAATTGPARRRASRRRT